MSTFRPWLCLNGHTMEIERVTEDGLCTKCRAPVVVSTSKDDVQRALREDKHKRFRHQMVNGKERRLVTRECSVCFILYETPYPNSRYCPDSGCRRKAAEMRRDALRYGTIYCLFCSRPINDIDKRRKFCNERCRNDLRRKRKT